MSIQQGTIALCRYRLIGAKHTPLRRLNDLVARYQAAPVDLDKPHRGPEETVGWVRPVGTAEAGLELPPDAPWDMSHCQVDDGFLLRMRVERRKVPAPLLQLLYKQQFHAILTSSGKPPPPKERRDLRDKLKADLLARALPALSHVEAFWRDGTGDLLLFSTGKKTRQLFEGLFRATFAEALDLTLVPIDPPLLGLDRNVWKDSKVANDTVSRLSLTIPAAFAESQYP